MATEPKLAIILGAGASFDVCPDEGPILDPSWCPPVVASLFATKSFDMVLKDFPAAQALMSSVRTAVRGGKPFEAEIKAHVENENPYVQRQVKELPVALQQYFFRVSNSYTAEAINYSALVNRTVGQGIRTAFITLNYDTLLEQSLQKVTGTSFVERNAYIKSNDWLLAKLHGSVDWGYWWASTASPVSEAVNQFEPPRQGRDLIQVGLDADLRRDNVVYYPAMVLPVQGKYDLVCPPEHTTRLEEFLADCSAYLFIGCSGNDEDLFDFLTSCVRQVLLGGLVTGGIDHTDVRQRFAKKMPAVLSSPLGREKHVYQHGFTPFLAEKLDGFLADLWEYLGR